MIKRAIVLISFLFGLHAMQAQKKVGVVLSGGGASGMAHVGVLKALEDNNIPIDYIAGTSIGALIGGFYAAGYSPDEIEQMVRSDNFTNWANGEFDERYTYFLKQEASDPSIIALNFNLDSLLESNLPTSVISSVPIDFGLIEVFGPANAVAKGDFNQLMVPFFCLASNITDRKEAIFRSGNLASSVRASMAYPFYLEPVSMDGKLMFDGGLYNNFPSDLMVEYFEPDYIIGSNVSSNFDPPTEDNIISQIKSMLSQETDYELSSDNGVIIEPSVNHIGVLDFERNKEAMDSGYVATIRQLAQIETALPNRRDEPASIKRAQFNAQKPQLIFDSVDVRGVHPNQSKYLVRDLMKDSGRFSFEELVPTYMKLISDKKIKSIYPRAKYNELSEGFQLMLDVKKSKSFSASFGGVIATKAFNTGFLSLSYQWLGKTGFKLSANTYFGKLYGSGQVMGRLDIPYHVPFFIEGSFTINRIDYFNSASTLIEDIEPSYLIIRENYWKGEMGVPVFSKGKLSWGLSGFHQELEYYQNDDFDRSDTADVTDFDGLSPFVLFERNSLNRKMYANKGSLLEIEGRFVSGRERTTPGSTAIDRNIISDQHDWFQLRLRYDKYFFRKGDFHAGLLVEGMASDQPFFNNYTATVLAAPAFRPLPESFTIFQERFRAFNYVGGGIKTIYSVKDRLDFRLEGYLFQPYRRLKRNLLLEAAFGEEVNSRNYIATFTTVYHTGIGPLAINFNYFDKAEEQYSLLLHFGYILFNKRAIQ